MVGQRNGVAHAPALSAETQICSCNNVSQGTICAAIKEQGLTTLAEVKSCTRAGTGCGGCIPLVTNILNAELAAAGKKVNNSLCEHFAYTRQELFEIVKIKEIKTFDALLASHGRGPWLRDLQAGRRLDPGQPVERKHTRPPAPDAARHQRPVPGEHAARRVVLGACRAVPGGEITPDQLIALGRIAKKYGLYTKITGGQRVDLFGAQVQQLPDIWEEVVAAGMESGHAYGKALRTVKSCVGTTWCRYGVQDSVGFAIRIEKRYRGIRAPHKIKAAVCGCIRECAEAQGKDFGLIATEHGYNLYVCGNGGSKPRHADLLAADLDEDTAIKYIDRFLMYYIQTADRLTRTSVWLENMEGGIEQLREVIIRDKLGICDELERRLQHLVDTYKCEWTEVVNDPERRKAFPPVREHRGNRNRHRDRYRAHQNRPADWPKDGQLVALRSGDADQWRRHWRACQAERREDTTQATQPREDAVPQWVAVGHVVAIFLFEGVLPIKYGTRADRRISLHHPRPVVCELRTCARTSGPLFCRERHPWQPGRYPQGRLPAAQKDLLA